MTEVVDRIKAIELNERSISQWVDIKSTFSVVNDSFSLGNRIDTLCNYDIGVKLGARVVVDHLHNSDHIGSMVNNVKRAVIEELYGEFRKPLIELEIVIAEGRQQEALEKVRNMHRNMFGLEG